MKKTILAFVVAVVASLASNAGVTTDFIKGTKSGVKRSGYNDPVVLGKWHCNFAKCKQYALENEVPLITVWSNGDKCGHCVIFEGACNSKVFGNWMKSSGCVFFFVTPSDKDGAMYGTAETWCYKNQEFFPEVRVYWKKGGKVLINTYAEGDAIDGQLGGTTGGKKAVAWFTKKLKSYKPAPPAPAVVVPYTIEFDKNADGATNEMAAVEAMTGTSLALPANAFIYPDFTFAGWSKTSTGSVAYGDKASVKNLTTESNGVVRLYAKWTRTTYHTIPQNSVRLMQAAAEQSHSSWLTSEWKLSTAVSRSCACTHRWKFPARQMSTKQ